PVATAWRLAQFNTTKQHASFQGLPSPASGLLVSTLPLIIAADTYPWLTQLLTHPYALASIPFMLSALLVAPIEFMTFKFKTYTWAEDRKRYSFLAIATLLICLRRVEGLALSMLLYLLWNLVPQLNCVARGKRRDPSKPTDASSR
ncbi:MAG: hypothetical protein AAFP93_02270, partial [Bacteroidota bacterium]